MMLCKITKRIELAFALLILTAPLLMGAAPSAEPQAKPESTAEKVKKILDQSIDITPENVGATLDNAAAFFQENLKVNFVVDRGSLAQMGIDVNSLPLNVKKQSTKARVALRSILQPHGLSYAILGDTVLITTEEIGLARQLKQKINVDLEKVPLETALKDLAKETATNLLFDKKVSKEAKAEVSLQFEDVPYETAVRLLCEQAGLKPVRMGNVLYVTSNAVAKELRSEPDLAPSGVPGVNPSVDVALPPGVPGGGGIMINAIPGKAAIPIPIDGPATAPGGAAPEADPKKPDGDGEKKPPEKDKA
jgi:hypothetical protein